MDAYKRLSRLWCNWATVTVVSLLFTCAPELGYAQTRFELRPLETVTLTTQQFLLGDSPGREAVRSPWCDIG